MDIDELEAMLEAPFKAPPAAAAVVNGSDGGHGDEKELPGLYDGIESKVREKSDSRSTDRERDRDYDRDRERDRGGRRERHRDRDRERDRERGDRDRGDRGGRSDRDRRRDRSRDVDRDRRRDRDRSVSPRRERKERPTREELAQNEIERDQRTVFVMQLAARVRPADIVDFFEIGENPPGKVRDVRLVTDRISRKSKGVGYVEFYEKASVAKAIAMTGQKLLGLPMIIQHTESEKNRIAEEAAKAAALAAQENGIPMTSGMPVVVIPTAGPTAAALSRLYVGSLDFSLTEDDIRSLFEIHGPIDFVNLHKDPETGRSKGFAFIQFKHPDHAKSALEKMHGHEFKGRQLKVGYSTDSSGNALHSGAMAMQGGNANGGMALSLDDDEKAGVALSSAARAALMAKLARRDDPAAAAAAAPVKPEVQATRCVLLKNMFDPAEETEENWDNEIRDDVKGECSKYGKIVHIAVDKNSQGFIYIKFDAIPFAQQAINALNGRFFSGKQISATFMMDVIYHAKYPEAAYL
ncbi:hypothetical protein HDU77_001453 [Chytriomyces hyalinus]|nr:hypothetical protein HDU77_001453 [Chytriomyces hyalinus]